VAKGSNEVETVVAPEITGYDPDQFVWETVHTEAADVLAFETIGDTLVAEYLGQEIINFEDKRTGDPESFVQLHFKLPNNELVNINAGYDLVQAFKGVAPNTMVRVQYLKAVDVGQQSPMKSYRVDQAARPVE
jgi:hypothetical protein